MIELVIRITMYKCIFVMLAELRTGGGAQDIVLSFSVRKKKYW